MPKTILFIIFLFIANSQLFAQAPIEKSFYEGNYQKTIMLLASKVENGTADAKELILAAKCHEQLFDYSGAIASYQKALTLSPKNELALLGCANAYSNLGKHNDALLMNQKLVDLDTLNTQYLGRLAGSLMELDRYREAERFYEKLKNTDSTNLFFVRKHAVSIYQQKEYQRAIPALKKYLELDMQKNIQTEGVHAQQLVFKNLDQNMRLALANCHQQLHHWDEAVQNLRIVLMGEENNKVALSKIAYINFQNLRNYSQGVYFYKKLNKLENYTDAVHMKNWGICEYFMGQHEFAAPMLDSLCNVLQNDPFVYFYAGVAYRKMGQADTAQYFLENAAYFAVPSFTADIYHHLGRNYAQLRKFSEAIETYKKVREIDPTNFQVLYDIAVTYEEYNMNRTLAFAYYQQFVQECNNEKSIDLNYALDRIKRIKEELFFEGQ